jgi:predicted nucleic acid-binding protein
MIFADMASGQSVFVDANTLVYHFAPDPTFGKACQQLLARIEQRDLAGFTSTHVLCEAVHRLMTIEAMNRYGYPAPGIARRLARRPADVQNLTRFPLAIDEIYRMNVNVLFVDPQNIAQAALISQQTGLLTGDALLVAVMREHGLTNLASHDADFDRVPGVTRYAPA